MVEKNWAVGILAYGSLIDDPGDELSGHIVEVVRDVVTPFPVEFARKSSSRGDAPTLVPHDEGARVRSAILIVDCGVDEATDMLWRRETRTKDRGRNYPGPRRDRPNAVRVETILDHEGVKTLLFTSISPNVSPLSAEHLAELAIESVGKAKPGLDGISYLMSADANGIVTVLSPAYAARILKTTGAPDLASARRLLSDRSPG